MKKEKPVFMYAVVQQDEYGQIIQLFKKKEEAEQFLKEVIKLEYGTHQPDIKK